MTLYIVPCSQTKSPHLRSRPMPVRDAYTGQAFRICRGALERMGAKWCVLSALYGFVWPDQLIGWYELKMQTVTKDTDFFAFDMLSQKHYGQLKNAERVIVLGSRLYADAAGQLLRRDVEAPVAGLPIGKMMHVIKGLLYAPV